MAMRTGSGQISTLERMMGGIDESWRNAPTSFLIATPSALIAG